MKRLINIGLALFLTITASAAQASVITYQYTGNPLFADPQDAATVGYPVSWPAYSGQMVIDESLIPGGTLSSATVTFVQPPDQYPGPAPLPAGLLSFSVFPFPGIGGSKITFTTNANRQIVSWTGDFLDGPPDGRISTGYDLFYIPTRPPLYYQSIQPGSWSIVPLPATLFLSLGALGLLGASRKWRNNLKN